MPVTHHAAILGGSPQHRSHAIPKRKKLDTPKRKPPSQRPENQMDETAMAIARMREGARSEKAAERPASRTSLSGRLEKSVTATQMPATVRPPAMRRRKSG